MYYTTKQVQNKGTTEKLLYAVFTKWPTNNMLQLQCVVPTSATKIYFLGLHPTDLTADASVPYHTSTSTETLDRDEEVNMATSQMKQRRDERNAGIEVILPALTPDIIPCQHAWVIALSHVENV